MSAGEIFSSFDEDEFATSEEPAPAPGIVISSDEDENDQFEEVDEQMSEAERRISLAGYYKQLARGGVFNDGSEEAAIVDAELKQFARERMDTLLNLGHFKPKVENPFTDAQIEVLKALADRYTQKQTTPAPQPQVRSLPPPASPAAPQQAKPPTPQVRPLAPPASARRASQAPVKPKAKPGPKPKKAKVDIETLQVGEIFEENGKTYKITEHPDTGKRMKVHMTAKQVSNPHMTPMPNEQAMGHVSEQMAQRDLNSNPALRNERLALGVAMSVAEVSKLGGK